MGMWRERHTKLLVALVLLITLAKGSSCNKTCTVADLELLQFQVDSYKQHGDRTQEQQQHMNSGGAGGGRKLKQLPMAMAVWVYNHCPCMVDNVVIYAPDGFSTIFPNGTDERTFSKVREHLYLINDAGPLQPSASSSSPSTSFWYTWYDQIELKPAFLVAHC